MSGLPFDPIHQQPVRARQWQPSDGESILLLLNWVVEMDIRFWLRGDALTLVLPPDYSAKLTVGREDWLVRHEDLSLEVIEKNRFNLLYRQRPAK